MMVFSTDKCEVAILNQFEQFNTCKLLFINLVLDMHDEKVKYFGVLLHGFQVKF